MIPSEVMDIAKLIWPTLDKLDPNNNRDDADDFEWIIGCAYRIWNAGYRKVNDTL